MLKIELLSDLCSSAGETYNSYVDTDVIYDDYGLPYIPAKRIKGCIREAALELVEWGLYERSVYEELFGKEGNDESLFSLDNAYMEDYKECIKALSTCEDKALVQPQRVLGLYTYVRTQTALKDGVADKGSLRNMRVVKKGLAFYAHIRENEELTKEQKEFLKDAVSMVKHIGYNRTRGLGLVNISLDELESKSSDKTSETNGGSFSKRDIHESKWYKISYMITLESPLICKSAEGSQEKIQDYIEGSKMLGLLAQGLSQKEFKELMCCDEHGDGIIVSNAYIGRDGERCTPVRASLQKIKDQIYDENGKLKVADMLLPRDDDEQWTPVGRGYASSEGYVAEVDTEINYHHRRSIDKSVGKATGKDDSTFYQLKSIRSGQQFAGFILVKGKHTSKVLEVLCQLKGVRMGFGRNAEYGNAEISVIALDEFQKEETMRNQFVVKLNSATILYNKCGVPCAELEVFKEYMADRLGVKPEVLQVESAFLNYELIGGFNVTWKRRKPIFTALGKGTVCYIKTTEEVNVALLEKSFIGERVSEGYGEIEVFEAPTEWVILSKDDMCRANIALNLQEEGILRKLRNEKAYDEVRRAGNEGAINLINESGALLKKEEFDAAFSKLRIIVREESSLKEMKNQVEGIESDTKRGICLELLKPVEKYKNGAKDVIKQLGETKVEKTYLYSFMNLIKYQAYKQKKGDAKES